MSVTDVPVATCNWGPAITQPDRGEQATVTATGAPDVSRGTVRVVAPAWRTGACQLFRTVVRRMTGRRGRGADGDAAGAGRAAGVVDGVGVGVGVGRGAAVRAGVGDGPSGVVSPGEGTRPSDALADSVGGPGTVAVGEASGGGDAISVAVTAESPSAAAREAGAVAGPVAGALCALGWALARSRLVMMPRTVHPVTVAATARPRVRGVRCMRGPWRAPATG